MSSSGYAAWSVVFGEQPTATKWNILGSNDSSFNLGTGFEDGVIINRHLAAASVTGDKLSLDTVQWDGAVTGFTTSSTSYVDTGFKLTLPAIGTWLIFAEIRGLMSGVGQFGIVQLYNFTTSTAVPNSYRLFSYASSASERQYSTIVRRVVTTTVNNSVGIQLKSGGAYAAQIENDVNGISSILAIRIG